MHGLVARGGHSLACDPVDLVEGVWPQQPVISCADEQLQSQGFALHVPVKLRDKETTDMCGQAYKLSERNAGLSEVRLSNKVAF